MSDNEHSPRLYVDTPLAAKQSLLLGADQAHYLKNVMRMKPSDPLRLFNGQHGEWLAHCGMISKKNLEITLDRALRPQPKEPDLWLCCAPLKKSHFDYMIEKATELGVSEIRPLLTSRTQIREVNTERCKSMAIEAAEQSERLSIPLIHKPSSLKELAKDWPQDRTLIICAEYGEALPIHQAFMNAKLKSSKAAIVTGPEGGFASEEFEFLKNIIGALFVRLGPRILRADTAAIAALSCWQAVRGDWSFETS